MNVPLNKSHSFWYTDKQNFGFNFLIFTSFISQLSLFPFLVFHKRRCIRHGSNTVLKHPRARFLFTPYISSMCEIMYDMNISSMSEIKGYLSKDSTRRSLWALASAYDQVWLPRGHYSPTQAVWEGNVGLSILIMAIFDLCCCFVWLESDNPAASFKYTN